MAIQLEKWKQAKKEKNLSYDDLAKLTGYSRSTITNIFCGYIDLPRHETVQAIESVLGLSHEKLEITEADKDAGVELKHREILSPDEMEVVDTYRAIKSEKGEKTAHAIKSMMKAFLDEK
ncbi:MAG: helix-turn-helix transcriptional regulator [Clostridia bacterium]|nr:helix-turn-helix transcriptional regulator [Clostridia bacterium]